MRPWIPLLSALLTLATGIATAQDGPASPRELRVLMLGNSFTYTNNLPALLRAVGASQGVAIGTETYAAPNGTLAERLHDGRASEALRSRRFDVVVLQEMGGQAACFASASRQRTAPCAASARAHEEFARQAAAAGARVLLFADWARDERTQGRIAHGMRRLSKDTGARVFEAAAAIDALHRAQPDVTPYPDGTHPSTQASLMLALALYRDIAGTAPVARELRVVGPLLPPNVAISPAVPLESQLAAGGVTVVPSDLVAPLVAALPAAGSSGEMDPSRRGRR